MVSTFRDYPSFFLSPAFYFYNMVMGRRVDSKAIIRKTAIYYLTQLTFNILIGALRETVKG